MVFVVPWLDAVRTLAVTIAPTVPVDCWWLTASVMGLLILAATIDAFTTTIPDSIIFVGVVAVVGTLGLATSWENAAQHLRLALAAGIAIWAVNAAWFCAFKDDALGMGDAKWTMLAVSCFGLMPLIYAWGVGAVLGSLFIGAARLARRPVTRVTFAPFLLIGLCAGFYWTYAGVSLN